MEAEYFFRFMTLFAGCMFFFLLIYGVVVLWGEIKTGQIPGISLRRKQRDQEPLYKPNNRIPGIVTEEEEFYTAITHEFKGGSTIYHIPASLVTSKYFVFDPAKYRKYKTEIVKWEQSPDPGLRKRIDPFMPDMDPEV